MASRDLAIRFENVFRRLLSRERLDLYDEDMSFMFEVIATSLLGAYPNRKACYFDGVVDLTSTLKTPRKVEFNGEMWVGQDRAQWKERFRATATDKRSTKQGIWITVWVGADRAEGELWTAFGVTTKVEQNAQTGRK
jgi:hypothetical protein